MSDLLLESSTAPAADPFQVVPGVVRNRARPVLLRISWLALRLVIAASLLFVLILGLRIRQTVWTQGDAIHYLGDLRNALHQGDSVLAEGRQLANLPASAALSWPQFLRGYFHRYDTVFAAGRDERFNLDYTPARLLVAAVWAWHVRSDPSLQGDVARRGADPLLAFNTACEFVAAAGMFLLVLHWRRRRAPQGFLGHQSGGRKGGGLEASDRNTGETPVLRMSPWYRQFLAAEGPAILSRTDVPWLLAILAAVVVWLNPALITDSHEWPQWDAWLLPFLFAALWLASSECWFAAGLLIAIAAMFKGQILLFLPMMILWPLFGGKITALVRFVIGFLFAGALMVSPWLVNGGWAWVGGLVLAAVAMALLAHKGNWWGVGPGGLLAAIMLLAFVIHPWIAQGAVPPAAIVLPLTASILVTPWITLKLSRTGSAMWIALICVGAIGASAVAFHGSWSWLVVGFCFPTWNFPVLAHGKAQNIPALLQQLYGCKLYDTAFTLDLHRPGRQWDVSMKTLLGSIYLLLLVPCAIAAAIHTRRNDPRVLIALTAPWVLMFALCPEMHTRYLLWAAVMGSAGWAISVELTLLNLLVIALSVLQMLQSLLDSHGGANSEYPVLYNLIQSTYPGLGWMVGLVAMIYFYQGVYVSRKKRAGRSSIANSSLV
jgi:hypothetical protein